jgi:phosphatidylglycerol:prolipoprotein diacylglycerol transferase
VPIAVIAFDFDPLLRLGDGIVVRWQAVALVAIIAAGLLLTELIARRDGLRADDLLFIAVAAVPGAVVGGRIGYVLLHLDYYRSRMDAITDPAQGSLELALAIVGGSMSSAYVASLLGAPIGRWLRAAALPLLFVLGAGKVAMVLAGAGQGQPVDAPWATAFVGSGPWASLGAQLPAHPSQVYEGVATLVLLAILTVALAAGAVRGRDGRAFFVAIGAWAVVRAAVSVTWRDPVVVGWFGVGGLIAVTVAAGSLVAYLWVATRAQRSSESHGSREADARDVNWADPGARPRF